VRAIQDGAEDAGLRAEEAAFFHQSRFCRVRGALSTLIRHGKRATFPKGEGKGKIAFKIEKCSAL